MFVRNPRKLILNALILLLATLLTSCNVTKYVPDGSYLLNKVKISTDHKDIKSSELVRYLRQTPNPKLFDAINFNVALYSLSSPDTALWINRFLRKIGDEPVIYDSILTVASQRELKKYLNNKGFTDANVTANVSYKKKKASVHYKVQCGEPYMIQNLTYRVRDPEIRNIILKDTVNATIRKGDRFDIEQMGKLSRKSLISA